MSHSARIISESRLTIARSMTQGSTTEWHPAVRAQLTVTGNRTHISLVILSLGPLCSFPVSVRPGEDSDARMDRHIERECSYMTGEVKARTSPVCSRLRCKKVLFVPITCIVSCLRYNARDVYSSIQSPSHVAEISA